MVRELLEVVLSFSVFLVGLVMILLTRKLYKVFQGGKLEKGHYFLFITTVAFAIHSVVYFLFYTVFPQPWSELANIVTHLTTALPFTIAVYLICKVWECK